MTSHTVSHAHTHKTTNGRRRSCTHRSKVELHLAVGVGLHYVRPRLAALDATGGCVELLAAQLWCQRRLEDVLAVHLLQLHVPPEQTYKHTNKQCWNVCRPSRSCYCCCWISYWEVFISSKEQDLPWSPPSLLLRSNGHWWLFNWGVERPWREADR